MTRNYAVFWWRTASILLSLHPLIRGLSYSSPTPNGSGQRQSKSSSPPFGYLGVDPPMKGISPDASRPRRKNRSTAKPPTSPMVDSALLRFLSTQKKQKSQEKELKELSEEAGPNVGESGSIDGSSEYNYFPATTSDRIKANIEATHSSWLGQFNSIRVTQKLISMGVEERAANEAGEVVQSHVIARTARRRVREFLKQRDVAWSEPKKTELFDEPTNTEISHSIPSYRLEDVVNLLTEFGLTGNDVAAIFAHTPSVALMMPRRIEEDGPLETDISSVHAGGETLEETLRRSFSSLLCTTLKLRKYDARKVLRRCPGLLTMRGSKSAQQIVAVMTKLGVSSNSIARDKNSLPKLLSRSPSALFNLISFLAGDAVRMPVKQIGPLLRRPECLELLDAVAPVPRMEDGEHRNETSPDEAWGHNTEVRRDQVKSVYRKMSSTAWTLRDEIGTKNLARVIAAYPSVLLLDASEQILPTTSYLMEELGLWEDDIPRVLQTYPALLSIGRSQMEKVTSYITSLEVDESTLSEIYRAFPSLLALDVEKDMMPVVSFLREIGVANVGRFVTRLPPVLGYSIDDDLSPKWDYLREVCLYNSFELSRFPAYFSYPLDRVIKTRYEYLRFVKQSPTQLLQVDSILRFGDIDFSTKIAGDNDGGAAFAKYQKQRKPNTARRKKQQKANPPIAKKALENTSNNPTTANRSSDDVFRWATAAK